MKRAVCAASFGWLTVMGCGGASEPPAVAMDMTAARASIDQVGRIAAAMSSMSGADAIGGATSLMVAHQGLVLSGGNIGSLLGEVYAFPSAGSVPPQSPAEGSARCTATSCTFTGYGFTLQPYDSYHIDGTLTRSGDLIAFDVTYHQYQHGNAIAWTLDGSLSTAAGGLDGSMHDRGIGSNYLAGVTWDVAVDYHAITLDAQGCPTGGSLHAVTGYDDSGAAQRADGAPGFERQASVAFGPGCR